MAKGNSRVIDGGKRNVRDVYDPADINLSVADKHDEILQGFQEQLDKIHLGEDGSPTTVESVVRMLNEYKDSMLDPVHEEHLPETDW